MIEKGRWRIQGHNGITGRERRPERGLFQMKKLLVVLLFTFTFVVRASAQSQPPSTPITVGQVTCGQYLNCYSVPLTISGVSSTAWIYPQTNGGFILFRPNLEGADYVTALVTSWTVNSRNSVGQVTQTTVTFTVQADANGDNDTDTVVGSITFNIAWVLGGRWHNIYYPMITGGFGAQSITQD
jgi:hypothetical protein